MSTDTGIMIDYRVVLKDLEKQLAGIDERRRALEAAVAAVRVLIGSDEDQGSLFPNTQPVILVPTNGHKPKPAIPPGFFAGKSPTQAYRDLTRVWPADYSPPDIADAFVAGGMTFKSRTALIQAIHSVLKRERRRRVAHTLNANGSAPT